MDSMSAQNMAKGLNVYKTGGQGAAVAKSGRIAPASASTTRVVSKSEAGSLPPLRLKGASTRTRRAS
jgi:hypothetical protein